MPDSKAAAILSSRMFRSKARNPSDRLRTAVESLPRRTRVAMLEGMESNTIIAGAYTDPRVGGICPMLAAHRNGGRTAVASFARSWDRFTGAKRPRCATKREIQRLRTYLEMSLMRDDQEGMSISELAAAERARRAQLRSRAAELAAEVPGTDSDRAAKRATEGAEPGAERRPTGERDRAAELRDQAGWGWLRPVREWDTYLERIAAAREQLHEQRAAESGRSHLLDRD